MTRRIGNDLTPRAIRIRGEARAKPSTTPAVPVRIPDLLGLRRRDVFADRPGVLGPERIRPDALSSVRPEPQVNHGKNVSWTPRYAFRPGRDIDELSRTLRWIDQNLPPGMKVKAGGSRHSWSPVAATNGVYIHPEGMKFIESLAAPGRVGSDLRSDVPAAVLANAVRIGSGTTIREINRELWARGKALPVLGGFDGQTLGGVLPTGTHGSVLRHGPLAEMVLSLDLVRPDGTKVRIEPKGGITDAAKFKATHPDFELVQDDRTFNAALINMGTLGVVHSYVVSAQDKFHLNEIRTGTTGKEAQKILAGGNLYRLMETDRPAAGRPPRRFEGHPMPAYHLELLWNVHTDKMGVTSRHPVDAATQKKLDQKEPDYFARPPNRNLFRALKMDAKHSRPDLPELVTEHLGDAVSWTSEQLAKLFPKAIPKLVDMALGGMNDKAYIQRSYNVFNIGDGANRIPAQSATISVPLRGDKYLKAMDILRDTARRFSKEHGAYQTGPISMRFVKGSTALLGDPEDVCKFEIIFGGDDDRTKKLSRDLTAAYTQALRREFGDDVRLHWGQVIPEDYVAHGPERLRGSFPGFEDFQEVRRAFDPKGRFLNPWQARMLGP